jgi:hypothetical protein
MNDRLNLTAGVQHGWTVFMGILPKALIALVILVVGYFLAKLIARGVDAVLERVGFDRLVERGGIKRALERTNFDASDIVAKIVFYTLVLFVLEMAFSAFGPNPVSAILTAIIAYLPNIFVAMIIVVVTAAVARGVKQLVSVATGTLSYGRMLANIASIAVLIVGIFAALDQLKIAPAIVQGLFYSALAIVVGSAIIAIGGGGIVPMRAQWEKFLGRVEQEAPRLKAEAAQAPARVETAAQGWKEQAQHELHEEEQHHPPAPRF